MTGARVAWLSVAPVKGLALASRDELELGPWGAADNRRFWIVDDDGRRYGLLRDGRLALVRADWSEASNRLLLDFPDGGGGVEAEVEPGAGLTTDFYGRPVGGRVVEGPFGEALSEYVGRPLRLVLGGRGAGVDRGRGPVSLVSEASLAELARRAGRDAVDARRFRMLVGVEGCGPHEEDEWLGRRVRLGEAVVLLHEQVARCAITTQNPDTGVPDLDTLRTIKAYRGLRDGKGIDFGVFGEVAEPGRVRVGDAVEPLPL